MSDAGDTAATYVDSHCHLDFEDFAGELPDILSRARDAGIAAMISIGSGSDLGSARSAVHLASTQPDAFATVGIHPHDAARMTENDWTELTPLAAQPRVVGVGETGLDYYYSHSPHDVQREVFRRFLGLSRTANKPVSCHIRDAHADATGILRGDGNGIPGVIHCFTGGVEDARGYLDLGLHLSFSAIVTFKKAEDIRAAAKFAPADRILVETDAPFLAPIPYRGKRNEPAYIVKTLECLAEIRGVAADEMARTTSENTRRLFCLG